MRLILVIFTLAAVAWPIETAPSEAFEKELMLLKKKVENLEKFDSDFKKENEILRESDHDLKKKIENMLKINNDLKEKVENMEKINNNLTKKIENIEDCDNDLKKKNENMEQSHNDLKKKIENIEKINNNIKKNVEKIESNADGIKEGIVKMRNSVSFMEKKEISKDIFLANPETTKKTLEVSVNNLHKNENREHQNDEENMSFIGDAGIENTFDGKISYCENDPDCCDNLTNEIDDIKVNIEHIIERLNDNTRDIIENQFEIQNNKKEIAILKKRSDYCAWKETWNPDQQNQVINYDKLILSNNYNISGAQMDIEKGEFTAGVSAIYQINVSLRLVVSNFFDTNVYIRRNGVNVDESRIHTFVRSDVNAGHDDIGGRYMLLQLDAGDTVSVFAEDLDRNIKDITFCINLLK